MKKAIFLFIFLFLFVSAVSHAGFFDDLVKGITGVGKKGLDESTVISGLKEALSIGTENAVRNVSRLDGYFANQMIKILMPEKIRRVTDVLSRLGFRRQVDDFVLSMNRAAEKAAPEAVRYFGDAIREMTFEDARNILNGGDTAATDYFRVKTTDRIYDAFRPVISSSMGEVGATRKYKAMMDKYESVPFVKKESLDLDHFVTSKALEGLFYMVGQEEKKIRTDPAARVTDLLKTVFSGK
jgi:hypothetical protein